MAVTSPTETRLIICDTDLYAYLFGSSTRDTLAYIQGIFFSLLKPSAAFNASAILEERARRNTSENWEETVSRVFNLCPHNLAERFLESVMVYRILGAVGLPDLLPLALEIMEADLNAYFTPRSNIKKPYRDHLPHQVRVAAMAHLLLSGDLPLDRWNDFFNRKKAEWHLSHESRLLIEHLIRLDLGDEFPMGDDFNRCVLAAALLAGLVHDIGYALKTIAGVAGDPDLALHRFGVFPEAGFDFFDPPATPITRLYRILWEETSPGERYSAMRDYMRAHPDSPHCLAGAMWLSYLPDRLRSEGLFRAPKDSVDNIKKNWARLEMICQLGSMMALMHDLPLESEKKRGAQGFRLPDPSGSRTLVDDYPYSAGFAIADILHEFSRPYIYTGPNVLRVYAPILGMDCVVPDEWHSGGAAKCKKRREKAYNKGILTKEESEVEESRIELFWDFKDPDEHFPGDGAPGGGCQSLFDAGRHGGDIPPRLKAWGLDKIFCQRDVEAAQRVEREGSVTEAQIRRKSILGMRFPTPVPDGRNLAIYPLEAYNDNFRGLRDLLNPPPLI